MLSVCWTFAIQSQNPNNLSDPMWTLSPVEKRKTTQTHAPFECFQGTKTLPLWDREHGQLTYAVHVLIWWVLTYVSSPRLDDDGTPTASLLLNLGHAFPGLLVGVVCGTYCNLVLDPTQTIQLNAPFTAKNKWEALREEGRDGATRSFSRKKYKTELLRILKVLHD